MRVLLIGSGGREHALAWAMAQSDLCDALYCAPGNAGIEQCAKIVDIGIDKIDALTNFTVEKSIDLVVIGPEGPLVAGLSNLLNNKGIAVFGPSKDAAQLEGSKGFMKDLCKKYNIPTAGYERFTDVDLALDYLQTQSLPIVIKADGLAAGKGVLICETMDDAQAGVKDMLSGNAFGDAGASIVIEEFLKGEEVSYFALSDGKTILPFNSAQDHKRAFDGDKGPNTGGMGAYSPARLMTRDLETEILNTIIRPTVKAMADEGMPFQGVLYAGLMIVDGNPKLIEYNVRFGDPECQTLVMRLQGDLLSILNACAHGKLEEIKSEVSWSDQAALCVVMAANGYPASYQKGTVIKGFSKASKSDHAVVFHAGTTKNDDGDIVNIGGRVLGITATGDTIKQAQTYAYNSASKIDWPEGFYRTDIGWRAV